MTDQLACFFHYCSPVHVLPPSVPCVVICPRDATYVVLCQALWKSGKSVVPLDSVHDLTAAFVAQYNQTFRGKASAGESKIVVLVTRPEHAAIDARRAADFQFVFYDECPFEEEEAEALMDDDAAEAPPAVAYHFWRETSFHAVSHDLVLTCIDRACDDMNIEPFSERAPVFFSFKDPLHVLNVWLFVFTYNQIVFYPTAVDDRARELASLVDFLVETRASFILTRLSSARQFMSNLCVPEAKTALEKIRSSEVRNVLYVSATAAIPWKTFVYPAQLTFDKPVRFFQMLAALRSCVTAFLFPVLDVHALAKLLAPRLDVLLQQKADRRDVDAARFQMMLQEHARRVAARRR